MTLHMKSVSADSAHFAIVLVMSTITYIPFQEVPRFKKKIYSKLFLDILQQTQTGSFDFIYR